MEDKETIHKISVFGRLTLETTLRLLANLNSDLFRKISEKTTTLTGETGLYKLLNHSDPVMSELFKNKSEIDLLKLKEQLGAQGLPFAFQKVEGGTNLYFRVKDEKLAQKAIENYLKEFAKHPKEAAQKVLKKPNTMTFQEKLAYASIAQAKLTSGLPIEPSIKAPSLGKGR